MGYHLVADYFAQQADQQMQAQLDDNQYAESELISIKVPATLPPYTESSNVFEHMEGSIDIKGVNYRYVKRRFFNDSLELLCIPNMQKTSINNARDEFFKLANDFVTYSGAKKTSTPHHGVKIEKQDLTNEHYFDLKQQMNPIASVYGQNNYLFHLSDFLDQLDRPPESES
jgi:hypothetical protein